MSTPRQWRDDYDPPEPDDVRSAFYAQADEWEAEQQARSEGWRRG